MSGLFGGKPQVTDNVAPVIGSISLQTSAYGKVMPLIWGKGRVSPNLMWYNAFKAIPHTTTSGGGGGGKGGASAPKTTNTTYTYTVAALFGLAEGVVSSIPNVWVGKAQTTLAALGFTLFTGTYSQNPFGFITATYPGQDLSYRGIAYIAQSAFDLGGGASFPNLSFEAAANFQYGSIPSLAQTFTATPPNTLIGGAGGFSNGTVLRMTTTGILPAGLLPNTDYFVLNSAGSTFVLSSTADAQQVQITSIGTGVHTATPFVPDANPKDVLADYLTNPYYGVSPSFPLGDLTAMSNYCVASGTFVSPVLMAQEQASGFVERLAKITCCGLVFSENVLKVIPYYDSAITGNGVTFTPVTTPVYALTDDDFQAGGGSSDPVAIDRVDPADAFNFLQVNFNDRGNQYNSRIAEYQDQSAIEQYGLRPANPETFSEIADQRVAKWVASMFVQRFQNVRNQYTFPLPAQYLLLEPMDYVTLTENNTDNGLSGVPVRITSITEDEDGLLTCTAEDAPASIGITVAYPIQGAAGYNVNFNSLPGSINPPVWFVAPWELTDGALELWMGLSGASPNFGGCEVWASDDGVTYQRVGTFYGNSRVGVTTSALIPGISPDYATFLGVDLTASQTALLGASPLGANMLDTLSYVGSASGGGELISFESTALTSAFHYDLGRLRRGAYGSAMSPLAPAGTPFLRVDSSLFKAAFPYAYDGRTLLLKFLAFNMVGLAMQSLADVSPYTVQLTQKYLGLPVIPNVSGLTLFGQDYGNTTFAGRDAKFSWRINSIANSFEIGSEPFGASSGGQDLHFKDYQVCVYDAVDLTRLLRTEYVTAPQYTYTYEKNFEDGGGVPRRAFALGVRGRGNLNQVSKNEARITVVNGAPSVTSLLLTFDQTALTVVYPKPTDLDWNGIRFYLSTANGFTPGPANLAYDGIDSAFTLSGLLPSTVYYFCYALSDAFGYGANSSQGTFTTLATAVLGSIDFASVTGTTKPSDNATRNVVTVSSSAPGSPVNGDLWYDSTNHNWEARSGGAWTIVSDVTANKTAAAIASQGTLATLNFVTSATIAAGSATDVMSAMSPVAWVENFADQIVRALAHLVIPPNSAAPGYPMIYADAVASGTAQTTYQSWIDTFDFTSTYSTGTVQVSKGVGFTGYTITGTGTAWLGQGIASGDVILIDLPNGTAIYGIIGSVDLNTQITLQDLGSGVGYAGPTGLTYTIYRGSVQADNGWSQGLTVLIGAANYTVQIHFQQLGVQMSSSGSNAGRLVVFGVADAPGVGTITYSMREIQIIQSRR